METALETYMKNFTVTLADVFEDEAIMILGVNKEIQTLLQKIKRLESLLGDAQERMSVEQSIREWLSELKFVLNDAENIIKDCQTEGAKLLQCQTIMICCNFSSSTNNSLRHDMRYRIDGLIDILTLIYEHGKRLDLQEFERSKFIGDRQTSSRVDPLVVGREVDVAANKLVNILITENAKQKCRVFAITGLEGIGKTTLAKKIFNHHEIKNYFNVKVWACVTRSYSETELLKQIIVGAKGSYRDDSTITELQCIFGDSIASSQSFFLVLDDVWIANVWSRWLHAPLYNSNVNVSVLVTTRHKDIAKVMRVVHTHQVEKLSIETSWDVLCWRVFSHVELEEELMYELKEIGIQILEKCEGHPLTITFMARELLKRGYTIKAWESVLRRFHNLLQEYAIK